MDAPRTCTAKPCIPDALVIQLPSSSQNMAMVKGKVICAGGLLDDEGRMKGSVLVMEFESKKFLDKYLESEPYIIEKVWDRVEVEPMNVVIVNGEKVGK